MDKLTWFKFSPSDWMMGRIQRCDDSLQGLFIRLCCLYWNKECQLTKEDAEIEIDADNLKILIDKKIISDIDGFINISFLDEQFDSVSDTTKKNSSNGKVGNLKRWHKDLYDRYKAKEVTLEEAIKLSQYDKEVIATPSPPDSHPIATPSRIIADKRREEKKREEKKREEDFNTFWSLYPVKSAKKDCFSKWQKLKDSDVEKILSTVRTFVSHKPFKDYTHPNPKTYLNQERWNDEIATKPVRLSHLPDAPRIM